MPYYHVRITQKGRTKDAIELNLSEKDLVRLILEKYRLREKFACGNELVTPSDMLGIKITKSEQSLKLGHPDFFRLEYRDLWRKVEDQEDVTKKFIEFVPEPIPLSKNVFIVHGKDTKPVKELKAMLSEFGLNPIVLHELPSGSMTLIEKLEKYSDNVGFAFAILTPDDVGFEFNRFQSLLRTATFEHDKKRWFLEETITHELKPRTRQNVLLEFGFFIGKLNRSKVCCLYKGNVDLPSDMQGIVYIHFNNSVKEVRNKIIRELKGAGYEIKL